MLSVRNAIPLGIACMLGGCIAEPSPDPMIVVFPATGRDIATFQQDDAICLRHATDHTAYDSPVQPNSVVAAPANGAAAPASQTQSATPPSDDGGFGGQPLDQKAYAQCMAARGDTVKLEAPPADADGDSYAYPDSAYPYIVGYPYAFSAPYMWGYPYGYGYGYPGLYMADGFYGGFGWYGGGRYWRRGRWGHGAHGGHGGGHGGGGGGHH